MRVLRWTNIGRPRPTTCWLPLRLSQGRAGRTRSQTIEARPEQARVDAASRRSLPKGAAALRQLPAAAALHVFVRLSSERASQAARQECSFAKKQESPPVLLGRRPQRARGDASSRRSLSQSEQQATAILRTRARLVEGRGEEWLWCPRSRPMRRIWPRPFTGPCHCAQGWRGPSRRAPRPPAPARRTGPAGIGGDQPATR